MSWIAVDKNGAETLYSHKPFRKWHDEWGFRRETEEGGAFYMDIPKGTSLMLTGKQMTWDDEPVELPDEIILPRLKVADVREFLDMLTREEITFNKMVELLNERIWKRN